MAEEHGHRRAPAGAYAATGQVNIGQVGQRSGGVATGMRTAGDARSEAAAGR